MELKDTIPFLPLVGTIITVALGYKFISVQVQKNRVAKWIDDFRKEAAELYSVSISIHGDYTPEKHLNLMKVVAILILYLSGSPKGSKKHVMYESLCDLRHKLIEIKSNPSHKLIIKLQNMNYLTELASRVIQEEQKKI